MSVAAPLSLGAPIRTVAVAGGGIAGWSAAAALKRRLPWLEVTILPVAPPADALADRMVSTLPSVAGFHEDLGLRDEDAVARTGSGFRLGTGFAGWAGDRAPYVHGYGRHGRSFGAGSFHHHWVRAARDGAAEPFDAYGAAATLAEAGRLAPIGSDALGDLEYGLHIDPDRYAVMLRAFAQHCGVRERAGTIAGVARRGDGFIDAVVLDDGGRVAADLFVDATGPVARLRGAIDDIRQDWRRWLPGDRLIAVDAPDLPPDPLDRVAATATGWRWSAAGPVRRTRGVVWCSDWQRDAPADGPVVAIAAGTRPEPWRHNVVAIGDAATTLEPLEWTNLHLAHSAIDRLVAMFPDRDCAAVEIADYNRQCADEAMRVRDFAALHYAVSDRPEPFWRAMAEVAPPPSLAHSLAQFRARGRLPYYEEETFARDSWLAVLIGQGVIPDRDDPLIDIVPPAHSAAAMAAFRQGLLAAVAPLPAHRDFHQMLMRPVSR